MRNNKLFNCLICFLLLLPISIHAVQAQDKSSLQKFAGKYAPSVSTMKSLTVEIIVSNDGIFLKNTIGLQMKLYQDSDREFHVDSPAHIKVSFAQGEGKAVDSFVLDQGGQPITFTRLEVLQNASRKLKVEGRTLIKRDGEIIGYGAAAEELSDAQYEKLAGERQPGDVILDSVSLQTALGVVNFELGTMFVPENRSEPQSRVIGVGFARFRAAQSTGVPPTFHLPGGPGVSFLRALKPGHEQLAGVLRYIGLFRSIGDIVLMDQRGYSERGEILSVKVTPPARTLDEPLTFSRFEDIYREIVRTAVDESETANIDLRGYTVLELADDVDDMRRALGYDKISLVGGSFGSQWSLAVMRRHPDVVARALLSGVEPLDRKSDMPSEVYAALQRMWYEAGQQPDLRPYIPPGGLTAVASEILERLEREPIRVTVKSDEGEQVILALGPFDFQRDFVRLAQEPQRLLELRHGQYESWASEAAERAVSHEIDFELLNELVDSSLGASPDRMALLRGDPATKFIGRFSFDLNLVTADEWPSPDVGDEFRRPVETKTPVMFVQGDWDTSTPVENALALAPYFPNSRVLIVHRGGHISGMVPISVYHPLVMRQLQAFLETGKTDGMPVEVTMPARKFALPDFPLSESDAK